jgi:cytochrome c553
MRHVMRRAAWIMLLLPIAALAAETAKSELGAVFRAKADAARGETLFAPCVTCHGADAGGEANGATPRIAGQHYRVLVKQLVDFRHGKRWDFRMEGMADQHYLAGPQDIADVAVYITGLTRPGTRGVGSGEFAEQGGRIYAAECRACHGADGEGNPKTGVPRLAGQHYAYLMRQMYDAVDGRRPALPRLHSQRIAPLDFEQVRAVADYLARVGWAGVAEPSGAPPAH